jgi:hypothetical protein
MSRPTEVEEKTREKSASDVQPMLLYFGNEFPNDDLNDLFRRLLQHSKDRWFRLLNAHLEESTLVLQDEISKLPHYVKGQVPHFDKIVTLSEHGCMRDLGHGAAMESALLIVLQLALFIG